VSIGAVAAVSEKIERQTVRLLIGNPVLRGKGAARMPRTKPQDIQLNVPAEPLESPVVRALERRPAAFICEAITLPAYDEMPYMIELARGELLDFTLRSDVPVDVLLCNSSDYIRWVDSGYDPDAALALHLEAEDVLAYTLRFSAPIAGEYTVLLMNWTEDPADLAIEIPDWLEPSLR